MEVVLIILTVIGYVLTAFFSFCVLTFLYYSSTTFENTELGKGKERNNLLEILVCAVIAILGLLMAWHFGSM